MAYAVKKMMEMINSTSIELSSIFNLLLIITSQKNFSAIFLALFQPSFQSISLVFQINDNKFFYVNSVVTVIALTLLILGNILNPFI